MKAKITRRIIYDLFADQEIYLPMHQLNAVYRDAVKGVYDPQAETKLKRYIKVNKHLKKYDKPRANPFPALVGGMVRFRKPVIATDEFGNKDEYESLYAAAKALAIPAPNIYDAIKRNGKCKNWTWRYK
jgi:hypothetical protein